MPTEKPTVPGSVDETADPAELETETPPDETLTYKRAVLYMCWHCLGEYVDGKETCTSPKCPLFSKMPYRDKNVKPNFWFKEFNPKRAGRVTWGDSERALGDVERQARSDRAKTLGAKRKKKET